MPHLPPPSPRRNSSKTTKVQKILSDDAFRQSIEVSWKRSVLPEAESLEVLARCKALNKFIKKGLLAEVDDDTCTAAVSQGKNKGSNRAAKQKLSTAAPSNRHSPQPRAENTAPAPLASRITAKESEALLGLLLLEDDAVATGAPQGTSAPTNSSSSGGSGDGSSQCSGNTKCDLDSSRRGAAVQDNSPTSTSVCRSTLAEPPASPSPDQQQCSQGVGDEVVDDWVIGLLNTPDDVLTPGDATHLSSYCPRSQDELQQKPQQGDLNSNSASTGQPALQQQQQQEEEGFPPVMPQAACREAHRQACVKPPHQQQQELRAATKHESINAAWQGFYSYWGPHAACTIQQHWRAYRARRHFQQVRGAAVVLQAFSRGHLLRVSRDNTLRLHREQHQQQQLLLLQQQALELEQEQQQQQRMQELLQQQAEAAAVTLQSAVRGWLARRLRDRCAELAAQGAAADASADVADWAVLAPATSMPPSVCSRGSDSSCSRGSSRQSHSRGSTVSSMDAHTITAAREASAYGADSLQAADKQAASGQQQWQPLDAPVQEGTSSSSADEAQYALPGLVIRNAAETRTASHKAAGQMGHDCQEDLARQLLQRAEQLGTAEGCKAADLGARTVMASSSSRQLHAAMHAVKTARPTI